MIETAGPWHIRGRADMLARDVRHGADPRKRATTVFGWLAGAALGLLINYGVFMAIGGDYPVVVTTFVLFVAGAFGGMALADRLGARGFRIMGIAAGVLLALALTLGVAVLMSSSAP